MLSLFIKLSFLEYFTGWTDKDILGVVIDKKFPGENAFLSTGSFLSLLEGAGLLMGLQKHAGQRVRRRSSSPKLLVLNTGLMSALSATSFAEEKMHPDFWGRLVESSVGAALANGIRGRSLELSYWSSRNREVDFVLSRGDTVIAIEVKSGRKKMSLPGIEAFSKEFPVKKKLLLGSHGIPLEEFFCVPAEEWLK